MGSRDDILINQGKWRRYKLRYKLPSFINMLAMSRIRGTLSENIPPDLRQGRKEFIFRRTKAARGVTFERHHMTGERRPSERGADRWLLQWWLMEGISVGDRKNVKTTSF